MSSDTWTTISCVSQPSRLIIRGFKTRPPSNTYYIHICEFSWDFLSHYDQKRSSDVYQIASELISYVKHAAHLEALAVRVGLYGALLRPYRKEQCS